MKKQLALAAIAALFATTACAAQEKPADNIMKDCPMMKDGGMMGDSSSKEQSNDSKPTGVSEDDHKKHHPAE